ncbi:GntR family transcriptional regulator [Sphaerisporangium sp. NPDC005288]|uniref:TetR/AcrR family transcriptional regulator C-terminal domain-containing protein n=1 Tax=Sphaerisporangium sp. NPDC005288 TaxID=3155114 RepID=UPI0033AB1CC7
MTVEPPYRRIVADIRRQIAEGRLAPGDRVPSTRQIARQWGVALATATRALTTLRQEGVVSALPRVGTVVAPHAGEDSVPGPAAARGSGGDGAEDARQGHEDALLEAGSAHDRTLREARLEHDRTLRAARPGHDRIPRGGRSSPAPGQAGHREPELTRERVVRAAIEIADAEGLDALSMRGVAARLGVATMSIYRHVPGKDELTLLMADAAFGEHSYPPERPAGWRARLEESGRALWGLHRRHPWLAQLSPLTRPLPLPNLLTHGEHMLGALEEHGLTASTMLDLQVLLYGYVQGLAVHLEREAHALAATGLSEDEWMDLHGPAMGSIAAGGGHPAFARLMAAFAEGGYDLDLDAIFELGLRVLLDGLAVFLGRAPGADAGTRDAGAAGPNAPDARASR